jgi:hypothetical protein
VLETSPKDAWPMLAEGDELRVSENCERKFWFCSRTKYGGTLLFCIHALAEVAPLIELMVGW